MKRFKKILSISMVFLGIYGFHQSVWASDPNIEKCVLIKEKHFAAKAGNNKYYANAKDATDALDSCLTGAGNTSSSCDIKFNDGKTSKEMMDLHTYCDKNCTGGGRFGLSAGNACSKSKCLYAFCMKYCPKDAVKNCGQSGLETHEKRWNQILPPTYELHKDHPEAQQQSSQGAGRR